MNPDPAEADRGSTWRTSLKPERPAKFYIHDKNYINKTFTESQYFIPQLDGNNSFLSDSTDTSGESLRSLSSINSSQLDSNDNLRPEYLPVEISAAEFPPSIAIINARSLYNKKESLTLLLEQ